MDTLFRLVSFQQQQQHQQQPHSQQHHHLHFLHQQPLSDHSFNHSNSRTNSSTSSIRSSSHHNSNYNISYGDNTTNDDNNNNSNYYYHQEECFNFFMDEEDFSSSSSHNKQFNQNINTNTNTKYNYNYYHPSTSQSGLLDPSSTTTSTPTDTPPTSYHVGGGGCLFDFTNPSSYVGKWASNALLEAGRAVSVSDTARMHQLIWALNEVGSPYGDVEQKLTSYFTQAIFTRMTETGDTCRRNMSLAVDKTFSFESTRKMLLKFQEVSPWSTFGHVASNGALIDALEGEPKLHIIDISNTFCTQWPTLLEALATRMDDTPHLKITTVLINKYGGDLGNSEVSGVHRVMKEIGNRLEKFARLMGVPFKFNVVHHDGDLSSLNFSTLDLEDDEALAINCVNSLHGVSFHRRDALLASLRRLNPKVVAIVEEEADIGETVGPITECRSESGSYEFMRGFNECLRWFRVYFESLDETFPRTSNEKLMLERAAGRALVDLLACPEAASAERRETAGRWSGRMGRAGLGHVGFSEEVCDDVRALLRRYKEGWSMTPCGGGGDSGGGGGGGGGGGTGIFLCWKDQPVVWASAWKP